MVSASLDLYRDLRDANSEAQFFRTYGNLLHLAGEEAVAQRVAVQRELPVVREALAAIDQGGYAEAVARCASLLRDKDRPLPLELLAARAEILADYGDLLPPMSRDAARRMRGEQEIIVEYEPEKALQALPALLADARDRKRLVALFERLLADARVPWARMSAGQQEMLGRIRAVLGARPALRMVAAGGTRGSAPPKARNAAARTRRRSRAAKRGG